MNTPPQRLFVAIDMPWSSRSDLVKLDPGMRGLRWLRAEEMHLTLSFLGNVISAEARALLHERLASVRVPAFCLPLASLGSFAARGRPSVVWIGVGRGHPHLFALHKKIQDAVLSAGLQPDLRAFKPHVTLARCGPALARGDLQRFLKMHAAFEAGMFAVSSYALYSSELTPDGAIHRREAEFALP
ncbi:MAG: RNA 2',3'-cyclic phosphodiesterase [Verrucomicrobia bacterium]|nr:RNA 2',3'-cyclic phosphodiesterase [Verrucomicrobiota bacterium]